MGKASLKSLIDTNATAEPAARTAADASPQTAKAAPGIRKAQTRSDTRQIGGHFKAEAAQSLKMIAAEQDKDVQELLAEALNMLFSKYGKPTRLEVTSGRRNRRADA